MIQVVAYNLDGAADGIIQTVPATNGTIHLGQPSLRIGMENAGTFEFTIQPDDTYYNAFQQMKTFIAVDYDGERLFYGRVLTVTHGFYGEKKVTCEGALSLLLDSYYPAQADTDRSKIALSTYLQKLITNHNNQVGSGSGKTFTLGEVPGSYSSNVDTSQQVENAEEKFGDSSWKQTKGALDDLKGYYGGCFRTRHSGTTIYLDWLDQYFDKNVNTQTIEVGENLIEASKTTEVDNVFTVVIPIGKSDSKSGKANTEVNIQGYKTNIHGSGNEIKVSDLTKYYSQADLNKGYHHYEDYVQANNKFGRIVKVVNFSDKTTQAALFEAAMKWTKDNYYGTVSSFSVKAIDMHFLNGEKQKIHVGDRVNVQFPEVTGSFNGQASVITRLLTCLEIEYDLYNPENDTYKFGIPSMVLTKNYRAAGKSVSDKASTPKYTPPPSGYDPESDAERYLRSLCNWLESNQVWYLSNGGRPGGPATSDGTLPTLLRISLNLSADGVHAKRLLWYPAVSSISDKNIQWARDGQGRPRGNWNEIDYSKLTWRFIRGTYILQYVKSEYGVDLTTDLSTKLPAVMPLETGKDGGSFEINSFMPNAGLGGIADEVLKFSSFIDEDGLKATKLDISNLAGKFASYFGKKTGEEEESISELEFFDFEGQNIAKLFFKDGTFKFAEIDEEGNIVYDEETGEIKYLSNRDVFRDMNDLKEKLEALGITVDELNAQVVLIGQKYGDQIEELVIGLAKLGNTVTLLASDVTIIGQRLDSSLTDFNLRLADMDIAIANIVADVTNIGQKMDSSIADLTARILGLEGTVTNIMTDVTNIGQKLDSSIIDLTTRIVGLEGTVTNITTDVTNIGQKLDSSVTNLTEQIIRLGDTVTNITTDVTNIGQYVDSSIVDLTAQIVDMNGTVTNITTDVTNIGRKMDSSLADLTARIVALGGTVTNITTDVTNIGQKIDSVQARLTEEIVRLGGTVTNITTDVINLGNKMDSSIADLTVEVFKLGGTVTNITTDVTNIGQKIASVEANLTTEIVRLGGTVTNITTDVINLGNKMDSSIADLTVEVFKLGGTVTNITTDVTNIGQKLDSSVADLTLEIVRLGGTVTNITTDVTNIGQKLDSSIADLTTQIVSLGGTVTNITTDVTNIGQKVDSSVADLTSQIVELGGTVTNISTDVVNIGNKVDSSVAKLTADLVAQGQTVTNITTDVTNITGQLNAAVARIDTLETDFADITMLKSRIGDIDILGVKGIYGIETGGNVANATFSNVYANNFYIRSGSQYTPNLSILSGLYDIRLVDNNDGSYTIQKKDYNAGPSGTWTDVGTFRKAASIQNLTGDWSGSGNNQVLTVSTNPSTEKTYTVGFGTSNNTNLHLLSNGTPTINVSDSKKLDVPLKIVSWVTGTPPTETTRYSETFTVNATPVWNDGNIVGQNSVNVSKGSWSSGVCSFSTSAGTGSGAEVRLIQGDTSWSGNTATVVVRDGTSVSSSSDTGRTITVDASARYTAGQNSVNVSKGSWSSGVCSFSTSAGTGSGAEVRLIQGDTSWSGNTATVVVRDGTSVSSSSDTGRTITVDASARYTAGQNSVNVSKGSWSSGVCSFSTSAGTGSGAEVRLIKGDESWSGNSVTVVIRDGTSSTSSSDTGGRITVDASARYTAGQNSVNVSAGSWITKDVGEGGRAYRTYSTSDGTGSSVTTYIGLGRESVTDTGYFVIYAGAADSSTGTLTRVKKLACQITEAGWSGNSNALTVVEQGGSTIGRYTVDGTARYTAGQNSVNVSKGTWSGGVCSFSTSAGTGSGAEVRLIQGDTSWSGNTATVVVRDGTSVSSSSDTGRTITVNASARYTAGQNSVNVSKGTWSNGVCAFTTSAGTGSGAEVRLIKGDESWSGNSVTVVIRDGTSSTSSSDTGGRITVDASARYTAGQNSVNVVESSWNVPAGTRVSRTYSPSAGSGSSKTVYLGFSVGNVSGGTFTLYLNDYTAISGGSRISHIKDYDCGMEENAWSENSKTINFKITGSNICSLTVDGTARYTAGQNSVSVSKGTWSSGVCSFTTSAGTGSGAEVRLIQGTESWSGDTVTIPIRDGTSVTESSDTGRTVSIDCSTKYKYSWSVSSSAAAKPSTESTTGRLNVGGVKKSILSAPGYIFFQIKCDSHTRNCYIAINPG